MSHDTEPRTQTPVEASPEVLSPPPLPNEPYDRRGEQVRRWGTLLVLIGVIWLVFELTVRSSIFGIGVGLVERSEQLPTQRFSAERVLISGVNDDVELVPSDGTMISVEATRYASGWNSGAATSALKRIELVTEQRGDTLVIEVQPQNRLGFAIGRVPSMTLRIALPADVASEASLVSGELRATQVHGDLVLRSVSGAITAEGTSGTLQVHSTSGDVRVRDHRGELAVETTSGDISARGALNARINSVSGAIDLEDASGTLALRTISGDIQVHAATDTSLAIESTSGAVELDGALARGSTSRISTISGDVRVRLASPDDLRLDLSTTSGELRNELAIPTETQERRRLSGTLGTGETRLIIDTTSGDIEVTGR